MATQMQLSIGPESEPCCSKSLPQNINDNDEAMSPVADSSNKPCKEEVEEPSLEVSNTLKLCKNQVLPFDDFHIPAIEDSIDATYINNFKPVYQRYYEAYYSTKFSTADRNLDTCIRIHTNKVAVIYLSPKHSLFQKGQKIARLNFQVSQKVNRLQNTMSGKGKRGAQLLASDSILCLIETEDNEVYKVYTGIHGKLLEINSRITDNPNLIMEDIFSNGFIAIIVQDLKKHKDNLDSLKKEDEYNNNQPMECSGEEPNSEN